MVKGWGGTLTGLVVAAVLIACGRDAGGRAGATGPAPTVMTAVNPAPHAAAARDVTRRSDRVATAPDLLDGWHQLQTEAVQKLVRELGARDDARSLLDAALLSPLACHGTEACQAARAERARLLERAARLDPHDPLIAFLLAEGCGAAGNCPAAYRRLAARDPDNLHAHLVLLHASAEAADPVQLDRALRAAAAASVYDPYVDAVVVELESILRRLPAPSPAVAAQMAEAAGIAGPVDADGVRLMHALGISVAVAIPPLQNLLQTCSVDGLRQVPTRRAPCLAILARMAGADTALARSVGLTRMVALTGGTPEGALWRERLREFAWVRERFLALPAQGPTIADLRLQVEQGEWAMMRAVLRRYGIPLQPPAGWVPGAARYRQWLTGPG